MRDIFNISLEYLMDLNSFKFKPVERNLNYLTDTFSRCANYLTQTRINWTNESNLPWTLGRNVREHSFQNNRKKIVYVNFNPAATEQIRNKEQILCSCALLWSKNNNKKINTTRTIAHSDQSGWKVSKSSTRRFLRRKESKFHNNVSCRSHSASLFAKDNA